MISESSNEAQEYTVEIREFTDCLSQIAAFDHVYSGPLFTWTNHQTESFLARKLDRVLVNGNWYTYYAQSLVEFLPPEVSDHCPAVIQFEQESYSSSMSFKFFNHWCMNSKFLGVVDIS